MSQQSTNNRRMVFKREYMEAERIPIELYSIPTSYWTKLRGRVEAIQSKPDNIHNLGCLLAGFGLAVLIAVLPLPAETSLFDIPIKLIFCISGIAILIASAPFFILAHQQVPALQISKQNALDIMDLIESGYKSHRERYYEADFIYDVDPASGKVYVTGSSSSSSRSSNAS
jgi:hypothetical protein